MMHCISVMREVRLVLLGNEVQELFFLMPWGVIKKGWDRLISRIHMFIPLLKIIGTGRVVARQLGPKTFLGSLNENQISCAPMCHLPSQLIGMSRKASKVQRVSAAARGLIPLPPDSILNSVLPRSAVMSQEHDSIVNCILPCSTVMSQENDSMTELRAHEQEQSLH